MVCNEGLKNVSHVIAYKVSMTYKAECGTAIGHASNILRGVQVVSK